MALFKGKPNDIPTDAILLTEEEALKYQLQILRTWKKESDVWAFKYGGGVLGTASALTAMYINSHYRNKMKLFHYGRASSYLSVCAIPALVSLFAHTEFVLLDVVIQKSCPVCLELRASALQSISGLILPSILAPLSSLALATRLGTINMPYITNEPMKVFEIWKKQTLPIKNVLFAIFIGQALLASGITYLEANSVERVNKKLDKLTKDLENNHNL